MIGIYAILALSLNMICGMTGLLQIGHAGFFAVGAYAAGITSIYFTFPELGFFNLFIGIAAAVIAACICSILIGLPCLRLRGDYLAIATLGFGEIVRLTLNATEFPAGKMFFDADNPDAKIGGPTGIQFTEVPGEVFGENYAEYSAEYARYWVIWIFVILTYIILRNIKFSRAGRAFMCIREDEIAAKAMGINVPRYKTTSFMISAAFAGLAGALFFHHRTMLSPNDFTLLLSIEVLLMVVLGGMGSFSGALMAAIILRLMPMALRQVDLTDATWLPSMMRRSLSEYNQILYAILLVVLIRIVPNGILGIKESPDWLKRLLGKKGGKA